MQTFLKLLDVTSPVLACDVKNIKFQPETNYESTEKRKWFKFKKNALHRETAKNLMITKSTANWPQLDRNSIIRLIGLLSNVDLYIKLDMIRHFAWLLWWHRWYK